MERESYQEEKLKEANLLEIAGKTYLNSGKLQEAFKCFEEALKIYHEEGEQELLAELLMNLGVVYGSLGQYQRAIVYNQQALIIAQQIQNLPCCADALGNLGTANYFLGNYQESINCHQQQLEIAQGIEDISNQANAFGGMGVAYNSLGNYQMSIFCYKQALQFFQHIGDSQGIARTLGNIGLAVGELGKSHEAIQCHQDSLTIFESLGDSIGQIKSLNNLGINYCGLGQYQKGLSCYQRALKLAHYIGSQSEEADALNNFGKVFLNLGQYEKAIDFYQKALVLYRKINALEKQVNSLNNLAEASYFDLEYSQSFNFYQQSLELADSISYQKGIARALSGLGNIYTLLKEYDKALESHEKALEIYKKIGSYQEQGKAFGAIGNTYHSLGEYKLAESHFHDWLKIMTESKDFVGQGMALNNLGKNFYVLQDFGEAEKILRDAINVWESLRYKLNELNDEQKISIFEQQSVSYQMLQKVLLDQGEILAALNVSEQGRSRALVDLLLSNSEEYDAQGNSQSNHFRYSLEKIQKITNNIKATIVEYSVMEYDDLEQSELCLWIIQDSGKIVFRSSSIQNINKEDISLKNLIEQTVESLKSSINSFPFLQKLYQILIAPIQDLLEKNNENPIIIIPHRHLFLVPFAALQDAEGKFLIEKYNIVTAPSIQILELIEQRKQQIRETSLDALVVGNPEMPTIPLTDTTLTPLAWSETEAKAIASVFNTQPITGRAAIKVDLVAQMPKARIIHLATHGLLDEIKQLGGLGAVALTASEGDNGFLTAGEIYNLKLNADLVVLSACSTGKGEITGDGVVGLSRCLIAASVPNVIVSLWNVDDLSTALLMVRFYQFFQQGVKATLALNEAQRWLMGVTKADLEVWVKENNISLNLENVDATIGSNLKREWYRLWKNDDDFQPFVNPHHWAAFVAIGQ